MAFTSFGIEQSIEIPVKVNYLIGEIISIL